MCGVQILAQKVNATTAYFNFNFKNKNAVQAQLKVSLNCLNNSNK